MSQLKFMSFTRLICAVSLKRIQKASSTIVQAPNDFHGLIQCSQYSQSKQLRHKEPPKWPFIELTPADNIFSKTKYFIKFHLLTKYVYRTKAGLLYRSTADSINHVDFIKDFQMADTYYSWFLINELHVWMLMVRLMAGGKPGMEVRKNIVFSMWEDADARRKQLGDVSASVIAPHMEVLGNQFKAAIVGYDEGLLGNDQILAGAVWRRFFSSECNNPELIEKLVAYIRRNVSMLDTVPINELIWRAKVDFIHHNQCWQKN